MGFMTDQYVGLITVDETTEPGVDHKVNFIKRPNIRAVDNEPVTKAPVRDYDSKNIKIYLCYEVLATYVVSINRGDIKEPLCEIEIMLEEFSKDDKKIIDVVLDAHDFYSKDKLEFGQVIEFMTKGVITSLVRMTNSQV